MHQSTRNALTLPEHHEIAKSLNIVEQQLSKLICGRLPKTDPVSRAACQAMKRLVVLRSQLDNKVCSLPDVVAPETVYYFDGRRGSR